MSQEGSKSFALTPMIKESQSSWLKTSTGRPGALSLLLRTPTPLLGSWATSTQWPFAALRELFFQSGPADPSVSATVTSLPSTDLRLSAEPAGTIQEALLHACTYKPPRSPSSGLGPGRPRRLHVIMAEGYSSQARHARVTEEEIPLGGPPRIGRLHSGMNRPRSVVGRAMTVSGPGRWACGATSASSVAQ